ncbi:MAG: endolytic transglycosylase MltG, partial [Gammaproteobacteria bacterium]|nr:endolytic transglycosylase MltG [Gammaproteobacteria bacterium]
QTDPTVIYGMGDDYKGDIRFRDLRKDTPYNTYTRKGLPPTPIAMPGLGAIKAVMHPAKTDYLYIVAIDDNSGRHKFSSTLAEHEKAVDKYQRKK